MKLQYFALFLGLSLGTISFSQVENHTVGTHQLITENTSLAVLAKNVNESYKIYTSSNNTTRNESEKNKTNYSKALEEYILEIEKLSVTADEKTQAVYNKELTTAKGLQKEISSKSDR